jgi:antagonist of KipI
LGKEVIHIDQCGFLSTLQDSGRKGFLQYGVSRCGAMDVFAMKLSNILIGNDSNAPVMEITQSPHQFQFSYDTLIAFAGGGLQPANEGKELQLFQPLFIQKGTIIELKKQIPGFRLYMAVAGGFESNIFLNSYSTDLLINAGGYNGSILKKGDILQLKDVPNLFQKSLLTILKKKVEFHFKSLTNYFQTKTVRVTKGPEWKYINTNYLNQNAYIITPQSNRMGYRLKGPELSTNQSFDIISSPVTMGTVQATSSSEWIILMADAQTVGGYPRVLQVIEADLPILAQKKPGDTIQFELVSLQEAEDAYFQQINSLQSVLDAIQKLNYENN